jgi:hypothetical protein
LFWNDEAETAMYATQILEYGYPKVHGPNNTAMKAEPGIIIPQKAWRARRLLGSFREKSHYQGFVFDVEDCPVNNIPSLAETPIFKLTHQFRIRIGEDPKSRLVIFIWKPGKPPVRRALRHGARASGR